MTEMVWGRFYNRRGGFRGRRSGGQTGGCNHYFLHTLGRSALRADIRRLLRCNLGNRQRQGESRKPTQTGEGTKGHKYSAFYQQARKGSRRTHQPTQLQLVLICIKRRYYK